MTEQTPLIPHTPGEILAAERRRRNLDVGAVSRALRLPSTVILAIEENRNDQLPPLYLRGFIRNYASLLELDPEPLLDQIKLPEPAGLRNVLPPPASRHRLDRWLRIATYTIVTTAIVPPLILFFVLGGSRVFDQDIQFAPGEDLAVPERRARVGERLIKALAVDEPGEEQQSSGHLTASAAPFSLLRPAAEAALTPISATLVDPGVEHVAPTAPGTSRLSVNLSEDSWVEISDAKGNRLEFDLLRAGAQRSYEGEAPFSLLLGRAKAVTLFVDGQAVQFAGQDSDAVVTLQIDATVAQD